MITITDHEQTVIENWCFDASLDTDSYPDFMVMFVLSVIGFDDNMKPVATGE